MSLLQAARKRHATKAFDPSRKIPENIVAELRELLRLAVASSMTRRVPVSAARACCTAICTAMN